MIVVISAVAGAYGAHLARFLMLGLDHSQVWSQIILGALAGIFSSQVVGAAFPSVEFFLAYVMSSAYLGTVLSQLLFGVLGGALILFILTFAERTKADQ